MRGIAVLSSSPRRALPLPPLHRTMQWCRLKATSVLSAANRARCRGPDLSALQTAKPQTIMPPPPQNHDFPSPHGLWECAAVQRASLAWAAARACCSGTRREQKRRSWCSGAGCASRAAAVLLAWQQNSAPCLLGSAVASGAARNVCVVAWEHMSRLLQKRSSSQLAAHPMLPWYSPCCNGIASV